MMKGDKNNQQEFRQTNLKTMSQSANSGPPIVIVNNGGESGGGPITANPSEPQIIPELPDFPRNNIFLSHVNTLRRFALG